LFLLSNVTHVNTSTYIVKEIMKTHSVNLTDKYSKTTLGIFEDINAGTKSEPGPMGLFLKE
tara:strand:- start:103 stop:285 length:183 start_codon:yes stop_codon:yes gene_type:complete